MSELGGKTILVVDDEKAICKTLALFLTSFGATVFEANSGRSACEIIKKNKIDFVITDVKMPDGDGVELLDNIKKYNPDLPIVLMVTGFADISREEARKKGAIDLLNKPIDYNLLLDYLKGI